MDLNTLLKHTSRSLYLSAKMLPRSMRPAFGLAYLLCRYADTIADTQLLPLEKRLYWVQKFPALVRMQDTTQQEILTRDLTSSSENPYEKALITHLNDCLRALAQIPAEQQPFIYEVVQAVCDGMHMDLTSFANACAQAPYPLKKYPT
ncbi:MAG: squalene/phytoene synthase family protein [Elusimicrobiaceae bacterium]|nr:squalene/phytoene synthase family protein [Elusimicrobiaceae bacterium]